MVTSKPCMQPPPDLRGAKRDSGPCAVLAVEAVVRRLHEDIDKNAFPARSIDTIMRSHPPPWAKDILALQPADITGMRALVGASYLDDYEQVLADGKRTLPASVQDRMKALPWWIRPGDGRTGAIPNDEFRCETGKQYSVRLAFGTRTRIRPSDNNVCNPIMHHPV